MISSRVLQALPLDRPMLRSSLARRRKARHHDAAIATRAVRYSARDLLSQRRLLESLAHCHPGRGACRRRAAARLINADADDVALISSVSYGVAAAAKLVTVPARSRVLVLENDHSSAVLEWTTRAPSGRFTVELVPRPGDADWTAAVLAAIERPGAPAVGL